MATAYAEGKIETCATKLSMARKILRLDGMMWTVKNYLPKNYKELTKEEQVWEMSCAIIEAYEAYKVARKNCAWKPDDGDFSDDEEDDKMHEVQTKVVETGEAIKKAVLAVFNKDRIEL